MNDDDRRRSADRLLLRAAGGGGGWVALLAVTSIAGAAGQTLLPAVLGRTLDAMLGSAARQRGISPGRWVAACGLLIAAVVACGAVRQVATGASGANTTAWLRRRLCRHVLAVGPRATRRFPAGDVVGRLVGGTADAGAGPGAAVAAVTALVPAAGAPLALLLIDPWLAVAFAAGLPALVLILRAFVRDTSDVVARYQRAQGAITARLLDALGGARTIAAAGTVDRESARVLAPLPDLRATAHATWRTMGRASAQGSLVVPLIQVVVLAAGGLELAAGRLGPGSLLAASQYAVMGSGSRRRDRRPVRDRQVAAGRSGGTPARPRRG